MAFVLTSFKTLFITKPQQTYTKLFHCAHARLQSYAETYRRAIMLNLLA